MKHFLFIILAILIGSVRPAQAEALLPPQISSALLSSELNARQIQNIFNEHKDYFMSVDYMLDRLLAIPENKRQYYFPLLHEYRILPHKITSHPEIIIWKGKKPTVIPPKLTKFAEKYLDKLPAALYPALDPDKWISIREQKALYQSQIDLNNIPLLQNEPKAPNPDYRIKSLEEIYNIPETLPKAFTETNLTEKDVHMTIQTIDDIPAFIDGAEEKLGSRLRDYLGDNLAFVMAWPFREWVKHVDDTGNGEKLDAFLKSKGWKNRDQFIQTADRLLKSYRASQMSLSEAITISGFRKEYPIKENETFLPIQMLTEFYHAKAADALFAEKYAPALKKSFTNKNLLRVGLPIKIFN